jgi:uncharacterized HAD superfamily protein
MRIAVDIDSTLHHYWDVLSEAAKRRFGIELPYEEQFTWGITRLREEQLQVVIDDTHSDSAIAASRPYPHAVEVVNRWHDAGHFIHVTSHRGDHCRDATRSWLDAIGLRYDDLHCSADKVSRCAELEIDLLIDDSPLNIVRALDRGLRVATLLHPWNQDVCDEEDVICARDWPELERKLEPLLGDRRAA